MSTLKIREYPTLRHGGAAFPIVSASHLPFEHDDVVDQTPVTFTSSSVQSAAFGANVLYIACIADANWCYAVGADPTATVNMIHVPANTLIYLAVVPGDKIAVIAAT